MERQRALELLRQETRHLLDLATPDALKSPVPSCVGWDLEEVVVHLGNVYNWIGTIVDLRLSGPPGTEQLTWRAEQMSAQEWMNDRAERVIAVLAAVPDDVPIWNFGPGAQTAAFWWRRVVHETLIHRVDIELARPSAIAPVEAAVASDTLSEFLYITRFTDVTGEIAEPAAATPTALTIHLHATDVDGTATPAGTPNAAWSEWTIDSGARTVSNTHSKAGAALRGPAWALARWIWGRLDLESNRTPGAGASAGSAQDSTLDGIESFGDVTALQAWRQTVIL